MDGNGLGIFSPSGLMAGLWIFSPQARVRFSSGVFINNTDCEQVNGTLTEGENPMAKKV